LYRFFSFGLLQSLLLSAIALEVERSSCWGCAGVTRRFRSSVPAPGATLLPSAGPLQPAALRSARARPPVPALLLPFVLCCRLPRARW